MRGSIVPFVIAHGAGVPARMESSGLGLGTIDTKSVVRDLKKDKKSNPTYQRKCLTLRDDHVSNASVADSGDRAVDVDLGNVIASAGLLTLVLFLSSSHFLF